MEHARPTFVMPHYAEHACAAEYLHAAVDGLLAQSDPRWTLVVVDDASPWPGAADTLCAIQRRAPDRVVVIHEPHRRRQGHCRNVGVRWAADHGAPFVLFHDADDVSHPERLAAVRRCFDREPSAGLVYSSFDVIDENGDRVSRARLSSSIVEILDTLDASPPEGADAWIRIGTETGYATLTSAVSVRTDVALAHPFPDLVSEDGHTWFRISAAGHSFVYTAEAPSRYRIPSHKSGSSERMRIGADYYRQKARGDIDGFLEATRMAKKRAAVSGHEALTIRAAFLRRLADTVAGEGADTLAEELRELAETPTGGRLEAWLSTCDRS